jgi:ABC-type nickel/cobalt efflux system permease component RcnA
VRRALRLVAVMGMVLMALVLVPAAPASAHPLGNFTVNLYSGLVVQPERLTVNYVLDMAEIPTYQELPSIDTDGDGNVSRAEGSSYATRKAGQLLSRVDATVGGRRVALRLVSSSMRFRPGQAGLRIMRLQAVFTGALAGDTGRLAYRDGNEPGRVGWREITAVGANGAVLEGSSVPTRTVSDALLRYPKDLLSSPLHVTSASFAFQPGKSGAAPGLPTGTDEREPSPVTGGAFAKLATWSGVSVWVFLLAMLAAMAFGAAHALLPGHGKTIMAAYLVGAGGRMRQAAQLGVAVALMHTASVLALGVTVFYVARFAPDRAYPWITLGSGVVILALGLGLLVSRLRGREQHGHGHSHVHGVGGHVHGRELVPISGGAIDAAALDRPLSRRRLAGLAAAGGILPSPTAIVVLVSTFTAHRVAFGLSLIVAFSAGLAAALVAVGIVALRARAFVSRKLRGPAGWLFPVVGALVIVGFGVAFVIRGATGI